MSVREAWDHRKDDKKGSFIPELKKRNKKTGGCRTAEVDALGVRGDEEKTRAWRPYGQTLQINAEGGKRNFKQRGSQTLTRKEAAAARKKKMEEKRRRSPLLEELD